MISAAEPSSRSEREERWLSWFTWPTWSGGLWRFVWAVLLAVGIVYSIWAVATPQPTPSFMDVSQRVAGGLLAFWIAYMAWTWGFFVRPRRVQHPLLSAEIFALVWLASVASWIDQAVRVVTVAPVQAALDGVLAGCVLYVVVRVVTLVILPGWRR